MSGKCRKLHPFPCCVDNMKCRSYSSIEHRLLIRNRYNFSQERIVVGFSGRLTKRKNIKLLIQAISDLPANFKSLIHLFLIGGGPEVNYLTFLAEKNNVNLKITGFLPQNESLVCLNALDIFCIPSLYDPSPKSLNEAMNFSLPILVSSECGTSSDLVVEGKNGFLFSPNSSIDLTSSLLKMLKLSSEDRCSYGAYSLETVSRFNPERAAASLYQSIQ